MAKLENDSECSVMPPVSSKTLLELAVEERNRPSNLVSSGDALDPTCRCAECGMRTHDAGEYHPYAACLMFKACGDRETVLANLNAVLDAGKSSRVETTDDMQILRGIVNNQSADREFLTLSMALLRRIVRAEEPTSQRCRHWNDRVTCEQCKEEDPDMHHVKATKPIRPHWCGDPACSSVEASDEPKCCLYEPGGSFVCTLPKGHAGQHEAWGFNDLIRAWSAEKASEECPAIDGPHRVMNGVCIHCRAQVNGSEQ